jgi:hypothetical protein
VGTLVHQVMRCAVLIWGRGCKDPACVVFFLDQVTDASNLTGLCLSLETVWVVVATPRPYLILLK